MLGLEERRCSQHSCGDHVAFLEIQIKAFFMMLSIGENLHENNVDQRGKQAAIEAVVHSVT
jgi:hypothetical protein